MEHQRESLNGYAPRHHSIRITAVLIKCTQKGMPMKNGRAPAMISDAQLQSLHLYFLDCGGAISLISIQNKHWPMSSNCAVALALAWALPLRQRLQLLITVQRVSFCLLHPINLKSMLELRNPQPVIQRIDQKDSCTRRTIESVHQSKEKFISIFITIKREWRAFDSHNWSNALQTVDKVVLFAFCPHLHHYIIIIIAFECNRYASMSVGDKLDTKQQPIRCKWEPKWFLKTSKRIRISGNYFFVYNTNGHGTMNFRFVFDRLSRIVKIRNGLKCNCTECGDVRVSNLHAVGYFSIKILSILNHLRLLLVDGNSKSVGSKYDLEWLNLLTKVKGSGVLFGRIILFRIQCKNVANYCMFLFQCQWLKISKNSKKWINDQIIKKIVCILLRYGNWQMCLIVCIMKSR